MWHAKFCGALVGLILTKLCFKLLSALSWFHTKPCWNLTLKHTKQSHLPLLLLKRLSGFGMWMGWLSRLLDWIHSKDLPTLLYLWILRWETFSYWQRGCDVSHFPDPPRASVLENIYTIIPTSWEFCVFSWKTATLSCQLAQSYHIIDSTI